MKFYLTDRNLKLKFSMSGVKEKKYISDSKVFRTFSHNTRMSWYSYTNISVNKKQENPLKREKNSCHAVCLIHFTKKLSVPEASTVAVCSWERWSLALTWICFSTGKNIWKEADCTESLGSNLLRVISCNLV